LGAVILRSEATKNLGISAGQNAEILRSAQDDSREQVAQSFASQKLCPAPSGAGLCGFPDLIERTADFEEAEVCATLL